MQGIDRSFAIIPARAKSTRFPNKVLASLAGKALVQHVWEAAKQAMSLEKVVIATDCETVLEVASSFGASVVLTPPELPSGTDRVAWAARGESGDVILNIQADEPLLTAGAIDALVRAMHRTRAPMGTLAIAGNPERLNDLNVVKVVFDSSQRALYFSRQPLQVGEDGRFYQHVGLYAFRRDALFKFCELPPSRLERAERLEQLRALEAGMHCHVELVEMDSIAVDRPEDLVAVEQFLQGRASAC